MKSVVSVTLPTVFALYIIGTLGEVVGEDKVRYISPFRYYDTRLHHHERGSGKQVPDP